MNFNAKSYLIKFDPIRDEEGLIVETSEDYVDRIQETVLPNWPAEVLVEWLYRHNMQAYRYAFLGFENFHFRLEEWPLKDIPDRGAFYDPRFCDNFENVERRSRLAHNDWLAKYMIKNGTWNTPPILLDNRARNILLSSGEHFRFPYHLLEGHRRLAFLNGLRKIGKAKPNHTVWIVQFAGDS